MDINGSILPPLPADLEKLRARLIEMRRVRQEALQHNTEYYARLREGRSKLSSDELDGIMRLLVAKTPHPQILEMISGESENVRQYGAMLMDFFRCENTYQEVFADFHRAKKEFQDKLFCHFDPGFDPLLQM